MPGVPGMSGIIEETGMGNMLLDRIRLVKRIETGMSTVEDAELVYRLIAAVAHLIDDAIRHGLDVDARAVDALDQAMKWDAHGA
jgi:hypothetical protein